MSSDKYSDDALGDEMWIHEASFRLVDSDLAEIQALICSILMCYLVIWIQCGTWAWYFGRLQ